MSLQVQGLGGWPAELLFELAAFFTYFDDVVSLGLVCKRFHGILINGIHSDKRSRDAEKLLNSFLTSELFRKGERYNYGMESLELRQKLNTLRGRLQHGIAEKFVINSISRRFIEDYQTQNVIVPISNEKRDLLSEALKPHKRETFPWVFGRKHGIGTTVKESPYHVSWMPDAFVATPYINDRIEGLQETWCMGESIRTQCVPYLDGKKHGLAEHWITEASIRNLTEEYVHGKLHGKLTKWDTRTGVIEAVLNYTNGIQDGVSKFWKKGNYKIQDYSKGIKHGVCERWHKSEESTTRFYLRKSSDFWEKNKRIGLSQRWSEEGTLIEEGRYVDGIKDGEWRTWHSSGLRRYTVTYSQGRETGPKYIWYSSGQLLEHSNWLNGHKHGQFTQYEANGKITFQKTYENDFYQTSKPSFWK